jgi:hypothetical protein
VFFYSENLAENQVKLEPCIEPTGQVAASKNVSKRQINFGKFLILTFWMPLLFFKYFFLTLGFGGFNSKSKKSIKRSHKGEEQLNFL